MTSWTVLSPREIDQFAVTVTLHNDGNNLGGETVLLEFAMRFAVYTALGVIFLMIIALIVKLMRNWDGEETGRRVTENSRLLLFSKEKNVSRSYGTGEDDLESGSSTTSSSEDLYDGKICVICYDQQRNCFFIPCGHCIACHACANRIMDDESKSCPICRGIIDKVKKLYIL